MQYDLPQSRLTGKLFFLSWTSSLDLSRTPRDNRSICGTLLQKVRVSRWTTNIGLACIAAGIISNGQSRAIAAYRRQPQELGR